MNTALNLYTLPHSAAADAYANELGREQLEAEAIQLCIDERAALIERTIRDGGIYRGHSILSVFINANDATAVRMTQCLATMIKTANRGIDSVAAALLVGSLEAEIKMQAAMIAAGEIDA
jgi:hypothetical protein